MSDASRVWSPVRITDARGRRVVPLDPVAMQIRGEHDVIDAETLRPIAREVGTGLQRWPRRALVVGVIVLTTVLLAVGVRTFIVGGLGGIVAWLSQRTGVVLIVTLFLVLQWFAARQIRLARVKRAMLAHHRCPHCGYDLRGLPPEAEDDATLCPECGCAWAAGDGGDAGDGGGGRGTVIRRSLTGVAWLPTIVGPIQAFASLP